MFFFKEIQADDVAQSVAPGSRAAGSLPWKSLGGNFTSFSVLILPGSRGIVCMLMCQGRFFFPRSGRMSCLPLQGEMEQRKRARCIAAAADDDGKKRERGV
jgi:hypothetical protein